MCFGFDPFVLVAAVCALFALICGVLAFKAPTRRVRTLLLCLALTLLLPAGLLFLALHPEFIDGRLRTYKAFYGDIHIGMTRDEVFAALDRRYPEGGARLRPKVMEDSAESLGFFMNSEDSGGEPNCEGIFLKLEKGRVKSKDYSPD